MTWSSVFMDLDEPLVLFGAEEQREDESRYVDSLEIQLNALPRIRQRSDILGHTADRCVRLYLRT